MRRVFQNRFRLEWGLFAALAVAVALSFALFTDHVWEDFFITFRHSRNLVEGKGLVYHPGERVHGFTSPLGTLLPALCYWLCGVESYVPALWLFRALSIAAFAGGGVLLLRAFQEADGEKNPAPRAFFAAFYLFQGTGIDFSINGMETGFMLLFLAWALLLLSRGVESRWFSLGGCWAALMWTRPDGCVYVAALSLVALLLRRGPAKDVLLAVFEAAGVCTVLYLPWFAWAWWYYGSPVPHTVVAKADPDGPLAQLAGFFEDGFGRFFHVATTAFLPSYANLNSLNWPRGMVALSRCLGVFAALYWVFPTGDRLGRLASACFVPLVLYLSMLTIAYPWYLPPVTVLGLVVLARGVLALPAAFKEGNPRWQTVAHFLLLGLAVERATLLGFGAVQMRIQQSEIEEKTRKRVGLWLREHGKPEETVFLEPVGYIGYFSGMRVADDPGLVSPAVARLRRGGVRSYGPLIHTLRPEWAVLRRHEAAGLKDDPTFARDYRLVKTFDAEGRVRQYGRIPGEEYLMYDTVFLVFRRAGLPPTPAGPEPVDRGP